MTAKEKAIELLNKMLSKNPNRQDGISMIDTIQAKLCAIVAVDEILNSRPQITDSQIEYNNYWKEVKTEINKL
jgi:hypothetical protein